MRGNEISRVVTHSLEECTKRIQSLNYEGILSSNRVQFWHSDEHTVDYEIRVWRFMNFLGIVSGDLIFQDNRSTLVKSQAELAIYLKIGILIYTLFAIVFTLSDIFSGKFPVALFFIPWGLLCWVLWTWMCKQVIKSIMKQLE
ncbi:MAG: hypothetical protein H0X30_10155 [Anaerolineae bacterium]|nr:hypothetical protein [Anaerolineae bacterium]